MKVTFFVPGIPKTAGSKRAFMRPVMRFPVIVDDCKRGADWKGDVKAFAVEHWTDMPTRDPVRVRFTFSLPRPDCHFGSGKNSGTLKKSAPSYHVKKPDVDKMSRAIMDALTGIVWRDDAQVVAKLVTKDYAPKPGVEVVIETLDDSRTVPPAEVLANAQPELAV